MNESVQKWVAALRSGDFEQTTDTLRYADTYCCLGVACELFRRETGQGEWNEDDEFCIGGMVASQELPGTVQDWLGLAERAGAYGGTALAELNDEGHSFEEIAQIIEERPEGLFAE